MRTSGNVDCYVNYMIIQKLVAGPEVADLYVKSS